MIATPGPSIHLDPRSTTTMATTTKTEHKEETKDESQGTTKTIKVAVGSKNPVKVNAVRQALHKAIGDSTAGIHIDLDVQGFSVPSGVPDQPMGDVRNFSVFARSTKDLQCLCDLARSWILCVRSVLFAIFHCLTSTPHHPLLLVGWYFGTNSI